MVVGVGVGTNWVGHTSWLVVRLQGLVGRFCLMVGFDALLGFMGGGFGFLWAMGFRLGLTGRVGCSFAVLDCRYNLLGVRLVLAGQ